MSGCLDSALSLALLRQNFPQEDIVTFTMGSSADHPDVVYARLAAEKYQAQVILTFYLLYRTIAAHGAKAVISHDGTDEQLGGYWEHRSNISKEERQDVFRKHWQILTEKHLTPLIRTADSFDIAMIFPYLNKEAVQYISQIPVDDRAVFRDGKKPLRLIARELGLPQEIIDRPKVGQCSILDLDPLAYLKK